MLSCDNAHAVHPNFADKSDGTNRVYMNGGIVIKDEHRNSYPTEEIVKNAKNVKNNSFVVPKVV